MKSHWHDPTSVRHWNDCVVATTPCRNEHFDIIRKYVSERNEPTCDVIDIGCGSGLAAEALADSRPGVRWLGFDDSQAMIDIARTRRFDLADVEWRTMGIARERGWGLEGRQFDCALIVQVLHLLDRDDKRRTIERLSTLLAPSGIVFVMDRFFLAQPSLYDAYLAALASRGDRETIPSPIPVTYESYRRIPLEAGDRVESIAAHLQLFEACGFAVDVIHQFGDRALLAAKRR